MRRLVLVLALMLPFLGLQSPASAAPTITTFTVAGQDAGTVTVDEGESFDVVWDVAAVGAVEIDLQSDGLLAETAFDVAAETITVDDAAAGTYVLDFTATDAADGETATASVTLVVGDGGVRTPEPVVVAGCQVVVPQSDDFTYLLEYDGNPDDVEELDAGSYTTGELTFDGAFEVVVVAVPVDGVTLDPATDGRFEVAYEPGCAQLDADFFTLDSACRTFTVTSTSDEILSVFWIDLEMLESESEELGGEFELDPGASRTVRTSAAEVAVAAADLATIDDEDGAFQVEFTEVEQDCGTGRADDDAVPVDFPVPLNAPDGGVTVTPTSDSASVVPVGPLGIALALAATAVVGVRLRRAGG